MESKHFERPQDIYPTLGYAYYASPWGEDLDYDPQSWEPILALPKLLANQKVGSNQMAMDEACKVINMEIPINKQRTDCLAH
jgi:hypothetical protein